MREAGRWLVDGKIGRDKEIEGRRRVGEERKKMSWERLMHAADNKNQMEMERRRENKG